MACILAVLVVFVVHEMRKPEPLLPRMPGEWRYGVSAETLLRERGIR